MKVETWQLKQRRQLPLDVKERLSMEAIRNWYEHWHGSVQVAFSGGKDSTVLLHLVRRLYPDTPAVFVNTGLEFPEVVQFVKETENVTTLRPAMSFKKVLDTYGFPVVSKEVSQAVCDLRTSKSGTLKANRLNGDSYGRGKLPVKHHYLLKAPFKISSECCMVMKKRPASKNFTTSRRYPYIGMLASDSRLRQQRFQRDGCNSFRAAKPNSIPLGFWTEGDIWHYIEEHKVPYSPIYDMGYQNTGCVFCMFGVQHEKGTNRFQMMKETHPKLYKYCMEKLGLSEVLAYMNIPSE